MNSAMDLELGHAPGAGAFETLRAEDEPWLHRCFVEPPEFERLLKDESVIVFGKDGYGKTALYRQLAFRLRDADGKPTRLLVPWRPTIGGAGASDDSVWVREQADLALDAAAIALMQHLAHYPDDFDTAPQDTQEQLAWFIQRCVHRRGRGRFTARLSSESRDAPVVHRVLDAAPGEVLYSDAGPEAIIADLIGALEEIGLDGVWVMTDDLEGLLQADEAALRRALWGFLAALGLFAPGGLIFKMFAPSHLEPALAGASGLVRRRVAALRLAWDTARLRRLVEARLALAMGQPAFSLDCLCADAALLAWLEKVGDTSPREWLDQVRPLVVHYAEHGLAAPIDGATWTQLRLANPPRLQLDEAARCILVGGRDISLAKLPGKAYEMLRYLYKKRGVATKGELYYLVYLGKDRVPRSLLDDKDYKGPAEYENLIDNYILKLRKAIEPEPSKPVLLRTIRGHGVELAVRW